MDWQSTLSRLGAIWRHDGHPVRPYALLTGSTITDGYVDATHIVATPMLLREAAIELANKLRALVPKTYIKDSVIVGQMQGSVTLASRIAEELGSPFIYTEKIGEGEHKTMHFAPRFKGIVQSERHVIFVEDVTTTGNTTLESKLALEEENFRHFLPYLLTFGNRTGKSHVDDMLIISCIDLSFREWAVGNNPYTADGGELVPPVRGKGPDKNKLWETYPD